MSNITKESEEIKEYQKKSSEYDDRFYSLLDKINENLEKEEKITFNQSEKMLYINGKIKSNDKNFLTLCEKYKFFLTKSLF
jgi:hypothetical protein